MLFRRRFGRREVTSPVERVSRFGVLLPNADRRTTPIMSRLAEVLGSPPFRARRSVTAGGGSEFIDWPHLQAGAGVETWLGRPALALAEGRSRERQPPHPPLAVTRHRPEDDLELRLALRAEGELRPPEPHPTLVPRAADGRPRRSAIGS